MRLLTIDTNVLVRLLVVLDPVQNAIVERMAAEHRLRIIPTVILETEWVLRSVIKVDATTTNRLLRSLLATERLEIESREAVAIDLDLHASGMDFADAMHVCGCGPDQTFVTFDRDLVRRANRYLPEAKIELAV